MPCTNDCHIIFEKYLLLKEGLETKLKFLMGLVPDNIQNKEAYVRDVSNRFDPSQEKVFTGWILKMMRGGSIRGEEDLDKTRETLEDFIQAKLRKKLQGPESDINFYKSLGQLSKHMTEKLGKVLTKREQLQMKSEQGFQNLGSEGTFSLIMITTPEAANKHLQQTGWCVKDPKWWKSYEENHKTRTYYMLYDSSLDVVEREERGEKKIYDKRKHRLLNFESQEYKNVFDEELDPEEKESQFIMRFQDTLEKNMKTPSRLYLKLLNMTGKQVPGRFLQMVADGDDSRLARELIQKFYLKTKSRD